MLERSVRHPPEKCAQVSEAGLGLGRQAGSCWVGLLNVVGMHKSFGLPNP